jgi:hypothetical protein
LLDESNASITDFLRNHRLGIIFIRWSFIFRFGRLLLLFHICRFINYRDFFFSLYRVWIIQSAAISSPLLRKSDTLCPFSDPRAVQ